MATHHDGKRNVHSITLAKAKKELSAPITRECHICKETFQSNSPFRRFCLTCKRESELYRMAEWLPQGALRLDVA